MNENSYHFDLPAQNKSIIKVIGVGGGGSNAVNHMFDKGITDVEFVVVNTDSQALKNSPVPNILQIGLTLTAGLGAGANPEQGRGAAIENKEEIREMLSDGTKMLFITAGMGGGTGTGAAPVIAEVAKDLEVLTVGIVTMPFRFEGKKKMRQALEGVEELKKYCDTVIVILNDKLKDLFGNLPIRQAFSKADEILATAAKSIAEIISVHAEINVDFEDVKTVMKDSGASVMGSAVTQGDARAIRAAEEAISSPLLNCKDIQGAQKILLSIMSGSDAELDMDELSEITEFIQDRAGDDADIIWGHGIDDSLGENIRVTVIATGFAHDISVAEQIGISEAEKKKIAQSKLNPKPTTQTINPFQDSASQVNPQPTRQESPTSSTSDNQINPNLGHSPANPSQQGNTEASQLRNTDASQPNPFAPLENKPKGFEPIKEEKPFGFNQFKSQTDNSHQGLNADQSSSFRPAEQFPVDRPVEQFPVDRPVEQFPVNRPVEQFPVNRPVEQFPVNRPAEQFPVEEKKNELDNNTHLSHNTFRSNQTKYDLDSPIEKIQNKDELGLDSNFEIVNKNESHQYSSQKSASKELSSLEKKRLAMLKRSKDRIEKIERERFGAPNQNLEDEDELRVKRNVPAYLRKDKELKDLPPTNEWNVTKFSFNDDNSSAKHKNPYDKDNYKSNNDGE